MKNVTAVIVIAALLTISVYAKQANKEQPIAVNTTSTTQIIGLHEAAIQGDVEAVREHIKAGSNLDEKEPTGGSSPLITAIVFGKTEIAKLLIEAGANVNFRNNESSSPLHTAAFFCHIEIIEMLLEYGADKTLVNNYGHTAFESVSGPYHEVKGVYEFFGKELAPLGLKLDYAQIEMTRPKIAEILR